MAAEPIELLSRAARVRPRRWENRAALYRNYLRMVVRASLGPRLRERLELSDVVQAVLVEVVRQLPQFTGQNEAAIVGWLRRLVGQIRADLGRYHSRAKRAGEAMALALDVAPGSGRRASEESGRPLGILALNQTSPSQAVSKREQLVLLAGAFAGLAEQEAEVLWLYFAECLSFEAIGQRLNRSRKSVRGLKHLKRSLAGPPGGALRYDDGPGYWRLTAPRQRKPAER